MRTTLGGVILLLVATTTVALAEAKQGTEERKKYHDTECKRNKVWLGFAIGFLLH